MGSAMAQSGLRRAAHHGLGRSPTAAAPLSDAGALVTASPAEARSRYSPAQCRMSRRSGCHDKSQGGRQAAHRVRPLRCRSGTEVTPGPPRTASSPSRHKGQIADGFPEPETLNSHAPRTQSQVTAMISVPSAALGTSHAALGASGGHFRAKLSSDTQSKNTHDLEPPYGIGP